MLSSSRASELKQQGALEVARDPHSSISAQDAELAVVIEAKRAGVAAFQFDPNASAEEKAAQARAVCYHRLMCPRSSHANWVCCSKFHLASTTSANLE